MRPGDDGRHHMGAPFEQFGSAEIERFLKSPELAAWRRKIMCEGAKGALVHWNEAIVQFY